jgi:hypothetical protein
MATKRKRRRHTLSEGSVTAFLIRAAERESGGPYPLLSRDWLISPDRFDDPRARELADKIITAYAVEHPPVPNAEQIADAVDWKTALGGLMILAPEHPPIPNAGQIADAVDCKTTLQGLILLLQGQSLTLEQARRKLLAQARREVAEEVGKTAEAVKQDHTRARRKHRIKHRPR